MTGLVEAIWIKRAHRGPMDPVDDAEAVVGHGLVGNVDRSSRRQVSIVSREGWEAAAAEAGGAPGPIARRANLCISGLDLRDSRGRRLGVGEVVLEIAGELRPCERMEEAAPGLQAALGHEWRGGVFARVLRGGPLRVGAEVLWVSSAE